MLCDPLRSLDNSILLPTNTAYSHMLTDRKQYQLQKRSRMQKRNIEYAPLPELSSWLHQCKNLTTCVNLAFQAVTCEICKIISCWEPKNFKTAEEGHDKSRYFFRWTHAIFFWKQTAFFSDKTHAIVFKKYTSFFLIKHAHFILTIGTYNSMLSSTVWSHSLNNFDTLAVKLRKAVSLKLGKSLIAIIDNNCWLEPCETCAFFNMKTIKTQIMLLITVFSHSQIIYLALRHEEFSG